LPVRDARRSAAFINMPGGETSMYFANRWVPLEVMNVIFILWAVAALVIVAFLVWLGHRPPPLTRNARTGLASKTRRRRKK
jgi:hypothetical protein